MEATVMRRLLAIALLGASLVTVQTAAFAQDSGDSNGGQQSKCEKRWDAMVSANTTQGVSRDEFMRKCAKGAYFWGGSSVLPEFALLGLAGAGLGIVLSHHNHNPPTPVSP
jgi:hypothetical protein